MAAFSAEDDAGEQVDVFGGRLAAALPVCPTAFPLQEVRLADSGGKGFPDMHHFTLVFMLMVL